MGFIFTDGIDFSNKLSNKIGSTFSDCNNYVIFATYGLTENSFHLYFSPNKTETLLTIYHVTIKAPGYH